MTGIPDLSSDGIGVGLVDHESLSALRRTREKSEEWSKHRGSQEIAGRNAHLWYVQRR